MLIALAFAGAANALGVAQDYPSSFSMKPGETISYEFRAQGTVNNTIEYFVLEQIQDTKILQINPVQNNYSVGFRTKTPISLTINIPEKAKDSYNPIIRVKELVTDTGAMIDTGVAMDVSIQINVTKPSPTPTPEPTPTIIPTPTPEPEQDYTNVFISGGIILLLIIGFFVLFRSHEKPPNEVEEVEEPTEVIIVPEPTLVPRETKPTPNAKLLKKKTRETKFKKSTKKKNSKRRKKT